MKILATLLLLVNAHLLFSQTNVRAWYADGQVWVVWEASLPLPETYTVYAMPLPFTNTNNAVLVGRPFAWEYLGGALKEQVDVNLTLRIPDGQGGLYQLATNEGLFVLTPHQAGALWFAVTAAGETTVSPGVNLTSASVPFQYDPMSDPVECHLQAIFPSPFAPAYTCLAYYLWADGRQAQWDNRPDFPVMANAAKNGMPSLFLISVPPGLDTSQPFPLTVWLHGGGGTANQSLAGSRPIVNLRAEVGVLLAHNDDLIGRRGDVPPFPDQPSWHFGWRKNYDPFVSDNLPTAPDTIVNYTQRRYRWIDEWLIRHFNIDRHRININGHSMGSAGSTALAKVFPGHYASATLFNNGFGGSEPGESVAVFGPIEDNYPTNLVNRAGETVRHAEVWSLIDNCSVQRDLPLIRSFHGKNDLDGTMRWDAYVVENYRGADSMGHGMQLLWSERGHGIDTGPDYDDHWHSGNTPTQQTAVDDVAYEETHFRSDVSFPAFFNHRLDAQNRNPGDGTPGTGANGSGDNWGSWGGYHRWDWNDVTDLPATWSVVAWLERESVFNPDNCPVESLTADLAIRKPRQFKWPTGTGILWQVEDAATGQVLQNGLAAVAADSLVVLPAVTVFRENIRRVRIRAAHFPLSSGEDVGADLRLYPNPGETVLWVEAADLPVQAMVLSDLHGKPCAGAERSDDRWRVEAAALPAGVYVLQVFLPGKTLVRKWIKT